tara:strand:- start:1547 stop:4102 length:2556 start_codon:yes stop_codon:yes gene_type:complete
MALNPKRRQDPEGRYAERVDNVTLKDAATFIAEATPIIGDAIAAKEVYDELQKDEPNYLLAGALGGAAIIGLVPGIGDAAAAAIKKGARTALDTAKRIEVDPDAVGSLGGNIRLKPKQEEPFNKTRKAYKLFIQREEKLYPLFVNAADEVPVGEFLEADFPKTAFKGKRTSKSEEMVYVPTKGAERTKGEKSKGTGDLVIIPDKETADELKKSGFTIVIPKDKKARASAPHGKVLAVKGRPGWHASQKPVATHLGPEDLIIDASEKKLLLDAGIPKQAFKEKTFNYIDGKLISANDAKKLPKNKKEKVKTVKKFYVKRRAEDQVFAEVDMADDVDYESILKSQRKKDINDRVPKGGSYRYQDGQADSDFWVVGGDMRVNRILTREESKAAQKELGVKDLPYRDEVESILKRKFAEGGLIGEDMYTGAEDYKVTSSYGAATNELEGFSLGGKTSGDTQMDEILNETKDPVSGNTAPVGATTAEVRDDIPIMASPNEFMIDAATRRYYGTPFFENLQAAAKQGFQRIKQGDESFFRDDELELQQEPQNMQEGGEVEIPNREIPAPTGGGFGGYGGTGAMFTGFEFKTYVHATKPEIDIVSFNGRPLRPIPEGYTLKAGTPVEQQEQKRTSDDNDNDDDDGGGGLEPPKTWRNTDVSKWTEDYYASYANDLTNNKNAGKPSMIERAMLQLVGNIIVPGGGFALEKIVNNDSRKKADQILTNTSNYLKTGKDDDGNVLTAAQLDIYNKARVNANFVKMNLQTKKNIFDFSKADPFASDSPEAASIIQQQQDYIKTLRDKDDDDDDNRPPMFGGAPGTFYGGTEQTETDLIQDESLDDDEFFEEFEKGTPGGVGNV